MKTHLLFGFVLLLAGSLLRATADDEVKAAAKKLTDAGSYGWRTTVEVPEGGGGGRFRPGPTDGKRAKDGTVHLVMTRGDNTIEAVLQGDKGAIKTAEGWQSLAEAAEGEGGQGNPGRFLARMLRNYKAPALEAEDLAAKAKDVQKSGDAYSGSLPAEAVKALLVPWRRPGGEGPEVSDPKGSVKFWLKDGALSKYQYQVQGTMTFNGNDVDLNRTTTVEIKDAGATKVEVPEGARKKLS